VEEHTLLARKLPEDAKHEIAAGDLMQGSKQLWRATNLALGFSPPPKGSRPAGCWGCNTRVWTI